MRDNFKEITQLVEKLKRQDDSAFSKLYESTYQRIYFLCFSILKNEEDAKDAVQDTYVKILANISSLQNDKLFMAWANKIAYNICMSMLTKPQPTLVDDDFLSSFVDINENNDPYHALERSQKVIALSSLINDLDPILRSTLIFKYFDNLKIKQIAEIMDCPEGTVKSRLNTAKKLLKSAIKQERKGGILISGFTFLPLRAAITFSASQVPMASEASNAVFEGILSQSGMSSELAFTPQPIARPLHFSYAPIVTAATVGAAAVTLSTVTALTPPAISNVKVHQPDTGYTNESIVITADIKNTLKSIRELYLTSPSGRTIKGTLDEANTARFFVSENGEYTIHVVTANDLKSAANATVTSIDNKAPSIIDYSYTETELILKLDDSDSGIDFSGIEGHTDSGGKIFPIACNEPAKTVTFTFPEENFRLSIKDRSGNISYYKVERIEQ